ncbi:Sec-independent protein translocase TatB [Actinomyces johnsonii]|uniref:Sec-independent protein translocase protein TatB n=1 Tax=Actinomyces johnsonii TaxID=544581 RepID=A0A508A8C9_9ACTO|nr:twin-arginine translocase TatA/TatE family subunit [Actinomyces johnsonii]KAA8741095.1 Sec-independent protein translocase TatB [Actinomyces johnsonii]TQD44971.1 Sec-independent protein translocase TatB [Actinomyces johnsonii]
MFGISGSEFLVIILVAVVVVGPQRLPEYTRKLTQMVRQLRVFLDNARSQIAEEVGPEMADLDLSSLDPRQYDPRKIVRDALGEDIDAIREDLTHPFRSVGSAAKEISDDAAKAVNDVVRKDRANSLSKQIKAKRAEQLADKNATNSAADDAEKSVETDTVRAETSGDNAPAESQNVAEGARADDAIEAVENAETSGTPESAAPPQGVLQEADSAETEAESEPIEQTEQPESDEQPVESVPVEVPASLVEAGPRSSDEHSKDASGASGDHAKRVRPLSPRDIVRAANAAARTRAEAARVAVDF